MSETLYSVTEAARKADRAGATVRLAIKRGKLKATKVGWNWVIYESDLRLWIATYKNERRGRG